MAFPYFLGCEHSRVGANLLGPTSLLRRTMLYGVPRVPKGPDLVALLSEWPLVCIDDQSFVRLQDISTHWGAAALPNGRLGDRGDYAMLYECYGITFLLP